MRRLTALLPCLILFTACDKGSTVPVVQPTETKASVNVPPPKPAFTKTDWTKALEGSYRTEQQKDLGEGVMEFHGCFGDESPKCGLFTKGRKDAFSKMYRFTMPLSEFNNSVDLYNNIHLSVAVGECQGASTVIRVFYNSKNGWLFVNKVGFLADGELVMEHEFGAGDVKRSNEFSWVNETAAWIANDAEMTALKTLSDAKSVVIRITGDKGYVTVANDLTKMFKKDAAQVLQVDAKIKFALLTAGGPKCAA